MVVAVLSCVWYGLIYYHDTIKRMHQIYSLAEESIGELDDSVTLAVSQNVVDDVLPRLQMRSRITTLLIVRSAR